jgi:hypothetical protein
LDLKNKSGEGFICGLEQRSVLLKRAGLRRQIQERLQKRFDAEVIESAAEEDRREISCQKPAPVKRVACSGHKCNVLT